MESFKTVEDYLAAHSEQENLLVPLRTILSNSVLDETVKWGQPSYTYKGKNVVGLGAFKSYVGLWFYQGALLSDHGKKLLNAQEGVTKAMRQWRFNDVSEIDAELINQYILESVENQENGLEIKAESKPLVIPEILQGALDKDPELKAQFEAFGLSKKREFAEHIGSAKREATQLSRLEKSIPMILTGIGLHDKYR